jgi:hypothetical protein
MARGGEQRQPPASRWRICCPLVINAADAIGASHCCSSEDAGAAGAEGMRDGRVGGGHGVGVVVAAAVALLLADGIGDAPVNVAGVGGASMH